MAKQVWEVMQKMRALGIACRAVRHDDDICTANVRPHEGVSYVNRMFAVAYVPAYNR